MTEILKPDRASTGTAELGLGSSSLVGGRTTRESLRLLDAAWDAGIRYFDTARVYGSGDAEAVLGSFARDRRAELTIATKFGIQPLASNAGTSLAKALVRPLLRRSKSLLQVARRHSGRTVKRGRFDAAAAEASLAASLRQLRTDYVDLLLMHECSADDWANEESQAALHEFVTSGRIRAFGSACSYETTVKILGGTGPRPAVTQFESDATNRNVARARELDPEGKKVTFGCVGPLLDPLSAAFDEHSGCRRRWGQILDLDVGGKDALGDLLLAHALWANPNGVVIFSSASVDRIAGNAALARDRPISETQIREFDRLVGELMGRPSQRGAPAA